jgi:hypothetical protein
VNQYVLKLRKLFDAFLDISMPPYEEKKYVFWEDLAKLIVNSCPIQNYFANHVYKFLKIKPLSIL